jgi:hypothetical protein
MKVAVVVIVLLIVLLPLMSVIMEGDGDDAGKTSDVCQLWAGFGQSAAVHTDDCDFHVYAQHDFKRKHLYLVVTKPVRRYEIVAGKLIGIMILNVFLLVVFGIIIFGLTLDDSPNSECR